MDLCNEAPLWMPSVQRRLEEIAYPRSEEPKQWNARQRLFMGDMLDGAVGDLKKRWPELKFTVSFCSNFEDYMEMNLGNFDLLENHLWLHMNEEFKRIVHLDLKDDVNWYEIDKNVSESIQKDWKKWEVWMKELIHTHKTWADRLGIPIAVTEGWGPILWRDHPALSWDWVKKWCAWCVERAVEENYWIIATSNFCGPQFKGMWEDISWHQNLTNMIRRTN